MKNNLQKNLPEFEDFAEVLQNHKLWIESEGRAGNQAYFMYVNLENFDFSGYELSGIIFKNCNLSGATFKATEIRNIRFSSCKMISSIFKVSEIHDSIFENCDISGVKMPAFVENSNFTKCFGFGSIFVKTFFYKSSFAFLELENASLNSASIKECILENCKFEFTDFSYSSILKSNLLKTHFDGCDVHGGVFNFCILEKVNFKSLESKEGLIRTALENAEFKDCNFKQCFFEEEIEARNTKNKTREFTKISFFSERVVFHFLLLTKVISVFIAFLILKSKFSQIEVISFSLGVSLIFLLEEQVIKKTVLSGKIEILKNQKILNGFFLLYLMPVFLMLLTWAKSFEFESFTFSFSILCLLLCNSFNSVFVIDKISKFYKIRKNNN